MSMAMAVSAASVVSVAAAASSTSRRPHSRSLIRPRHAQVAAVRPAFSKLSCKRLGGKAATSMRYTADAAEDTPSIRQMFPRGTEGIEHAEEIMLDSCSTKTGEAAVRCWEAYDAFEEEKKRAMETCDLSNIETCQELSMLEKFAESVKGTDAIVAIESMKETAYEYRRRFDSLHQAFAATDTDNSGGIDLTELKAMLSSFDVKMPNELVEAMFAKADKDSNGVIDTEEFEKFLWHPKGLFGDEGDEQVDPFLRHAAKRREAGEWHVSD
eukprot:jgi/Chlat1/5212/Chrsp33S05181